MHSLKAPHKAFRAETFLAAVVSLFLLFFSDAPLLAQDHKPGKRVASSKGKHTDDRHGRTPPAISRPFVRQTRFGKTVVGGQGELLRGVVVSVFQFRRDQISESGGQRIDDNLDPAHWDHLKRNGINAVRLVFFDPWQRSHGDPDIDPNRPFPFMSLLPEDVIVQGGLREEADAIIAANKQILAEDFSRIVDLAAERGMYVMLNYHDTFGYRDPDWQAGISEGRHQFSYKVGSTRYLDTFWDVAAPLLNDRTNVFFELTNEPVPYHPNDYGADDVAELAGCYRRVRTMAPDTHLVLGSFATTAHFGDRSMLTVATELEQAGVSFQNASIGFHPYDISDLPHTARNFRRLMQRYAVVNTEQGYPESVDDGAEDPDARGFGRYHLGQQSMERFNASWFAWNTSGREEFDANYLGIVKPDSISRRYYWGWELLMADSLNRLQQSRNFFARYLYRYSSHIFNWLTYF